MIDTKTNAGAAFAMDVAEFCFRQMAKVCPTSTWSSWMSLQLLPFLLQCRFTMFHILFLKVTEYAFENQLAELEQVPLVMRG